MATPKELNRLLWWAINQEGYLKDLLANPGKVAKESGIKLTKAQAKLFQDYKQVMVQYNKMAASARKALTTPRVVTIVGTLP